MRTILVVCGAGASSTFLALAMRKLAAKQGIPLHIEPVGEAQLPERLREADAVLVGPHLSARFSALQAQAAECGALAVLLPDGDVGASGAERALGSALAVLDRTPDQPAATPTLSTPTTTRTE